MFTEFADHVAVQAIRKGIRDRVEGRAPPSLALEGAQIAGWLLTFGELGVGVLLITKSQRWGVAWLVALGAGPLLFFCLYGPAPLWGTALLPWFYLAFIFRACRWLRSFDRFHEGQALVRVP